jgi:hypothetical protein
MNIKLKIGLVMVAVAMVSAIAAWAGSSGTTNAVNKTMDASLAGGAKLQAGVVTSLDGIVTWADATETRVDAYDAAGGAGSVSNQTGKVYVSNVVVVAGGTVSLPAGSIDATEIGTANFLVALSNATSIISINGTNYYLKVAP